MLGIALTQSEQVNVHLITHARWLQVLLNSSATLLAFSSMDSTHGSMQNAASTCLAGQLSTCLNATVTSLDLDIRTNVAIGTGSLCIATRADSLANRSPCNTSAQTNLTNVALAESLGAEVYVLNKTLAESTAEFEVRLHCCSADACARDCAKGLARALYSSLIVHTTAHAQRSASALWLTCVLCMPT